MKKMYGLLLVAALCAGLCACTAAFPAASAASALSAPMAGKTLSILGDSISTFDGVSNNAALLPALGGNDPFFPQQEIAAEADTWWRQATDALGMTLLINNSYSGGWVTADMAGLGGTSAMGRSTALGTAAAAPDVIAFFMGTNDCRFGVPAGSADTIDPAALPLAEGVLPADFATGYATVLARMKNAYPEAVIYCCTLPAALVDGCNADTIGAYNAVIHAVAQTMGCQVADLAADSAISYDALAQYTLDGVHPNKAGMQQLAQAFALALR